MTKKAILLMTFGTPEGYTFEDIARFFTNIRRGVRPTDQEIQHLYDNYQKIGGSPLQEISKQQAAKLQERVQGEYTVYFANKFSSPFIPEVVKQMEQDGIEECLGLALEPHYSYYSIYGYEKFIESKTIRFHMVKDWYHNPNLLEFWEQEIKKILTEEVKDDSFKVFFSAHSVPVIALEFEDPYIDQIYKNGQIIAERLGLEKHQYTHTWQSESDIGLPWMKPDVLEYLREQTEHPEHYIFIPISFISEHIEVLYDNDIECKDLCDEFGVGYHRSPMPDDHPLLVEALYETVRAHETESFTLKTHEEETLDEMLPPETSKDILEQESDIQMPEFVKKLIAKKGRENVKMPEFVKRMLEQRAKQKKQ